MFRKILGDAKFLSDMLQSPRIDLCSATDLIYTLRQIFEEYCNKEECFNELWHTVIKTCVKCEISTEFKQKRGTQTSGRLDDSEVTSTLGQRSKVDSKEIFRENVFLPITKAMIGEMEKRFSKSNCNIMKGIQALNPSSSNFLKEEMVLLFAEAYGSDLQDLKNELNQARRLFERNRAKGKEPPTTLMDLVKFLDPLRTSYLSFFVYVRLQLSCQ